MTLGPTFVASPGFASLAPGIGPTASLTSPAHLLPAAGGELAPDMSPNLALILVIGALFIAGTYLILERALTRVLIGIVLLGNGLNLLILLAGGRAGGAPIVGDTDPSAMSDPLPQAMVLTSIVITLGMTAFLLAMAYRSWQLTGRDDVQDDVEDRLVARRAEAEAELGDRDPHWVDDAARLTRDETEPGEDGTPATPSAPRTPGSPSGRAGRDTGSTAQGPPSGGTGRDSRSATPVPPSGRAGRDTGSAPQGPPSGNDAPTPPADTTGGRG